MEEIFQPAKIILQRDKTTRVYFKLMEEGCYCNVIVIDNIINESAQSRDTVRISRLHTLKSVGKDSLHIAFVTGGRLLLFRNLVQRSL